MLNTGVSGIGATYVGFGSSGGAAVIPKLNDSRVLTAAVGKVNNIAKSAVISGTATPSGTVTIGGKTVDVNASGNWSMTVEGLSVGKNDLVAIQRFNNAEVDRKTVSPEIVEGGTLVGVDQGPVELERGESTQVPFVVENRDARTNTDGTVTLEAPEGTTFDEQTTVQGQWRQVGETGWENSTSIPLTNGTRSDDNTTITFDVDWAANHGANEQYRFMVGVTATDDAPAGSDAMDFSMPGTSSKGDFLAEGKTTTTIETEAVDLVARITSIDHAAKTAVISGTATPGATVKIGEKSVEADAETGAWSITVEDLESGKNTLHVVQEIDDKEHDSKDVDVTVNDAAITGQDGAAVTLERDQVTSVESQFKTNGSISRPQGKVEFTAPEGTTFREGQTTINGSFKKPGDTSWTNSAMTLTNGVRSEDGTKYTYDFRPTHSGWNLPKDSLMRWNIGVTTPVDAEAGTFPMTTKLVGTAIEGAFNTTSSTATTIEAGSSELAPITLTGPASVTPGRSNTFTGKAEPGATFRVLNVSGTQIVPGTFEVDGEGNWTFNRVVSNGASNFRFVIEQTKNGQTVKSELFTVDATALAPITLSGPAAVRPGVSNTFTGKAEPGATFRVLNVSGTQIVPGTFEVDGEGNWTFNRVVSNGASNFRFVIEQTMNGQTASSELFTVNAAALTPVTVTTPERVTPGRSNTFTGTGEPGATFRVLNVSGTQIVPGTFEVDGEGNWTFNRVVSNGASNFRFVIEQSKNGQTEKSALFTIEAAGLAPVTVANRSVTPGVLNTFTGTGEPGASYRVLNITGTQIVPGTFEVDAQGNWTFDRAVSRGATEFRFALEQTKNGRTELSELFTLPADTK
ncbi:hypothetical protein [Curtobacterium flaccumfaciens]|uniref:hypothetical protein n=1 Tax=Curtobacterium flaccumfaciens TaxID=2035 RepID=UPI001BDDD56F|nr:hypothetical protein [Curtobacterium flaccumfaciens]MBT1682854.1 hypothetical protein [Curtobacterium flaccumfaciens pv. flaccumfaciens]